jgi:hypothetical protein
MSDVPKIGCILRDMGLLDDHDIEEILDQQSRTGQKFGHIAMRWGLATPEQVWQAWAHQLSFEARQADLDELGTDSTALLRVAPEIAIQYRIWPLRLWGDNLVIATAPDCPTDVIDELSERLGLNVHRCVVPGWQLDDYIHRFYITPETPDTDTLQAATTL